VETNTIDGNKDKKMIKYLLLSKMEKRQIAYIMHIHKEIKPLNNTFFPEG